MFRFRRRWLAWCLLFFVSLFFCLEFYPWSTEQANQSVAAMDRSVIASSSSGGAQLSAQTVQRGLEHYKAGKFTEAIALWQQALPQISAATDRAVVYSNLALAYRQIGQLDRAIAQWEQAIQIYRKNNKATQKPLAGLLTDQAQAYSDLGQHRRAIILLQSAIEIATSNQDQLIQAAAQGALGNAHWALGEYEKALTAHQTSLKISRELNNYTYIATALNNLGNVYVSRGSRYEYQANSAALEGNDKEAAQLTQSANQDKTEARKLFEESVQTAQKVANSEEVRGLMNLNWLIFRNQETGFRERQSNGVRSNLEQRRIDKGQLTNSDQNLIVRNWNRVKELLSGAADSRDKAYALINLAEQVLKIGQLNQQSSNLQPSSLLEESLVVARNIGDARAESFALGSLGQLQEATKDYGKAMELTRQAQFSAQQINAPDSLYRWQWQAARILKATGEKQKAIAAYEQAIASLQSIRGDIVAANKELQFDFREQVEPVYRELMALLLESPLQQSSEQKKTNTQKHKIVNQDLAPFSLGSKPRHGINEQSSAKSEVNSESFPINKVVDTLELLKLAELQNFFGDECVQVALSQGGGNTDLTNTNAVVIYSVILDNQTQMILRSPNGSMTNYLVAISKQSIEKEIDQLRYFLESRATEEYLAQAQKIYDLLIRPMAADLAAIKPSTLVFINDGVLRKVPMAALHDGKEFLVQKYPIATTPSLSLTARKPRDRSHLEALSVGLSVERSPFAPLVNVKAEVEAVNKIIGGTELLDKAFTLSNLRSQLQKRSYPIVHIATHGKFGVDAESTFLVGYDQRITIEQLDNLLRSRRGREPVELLTLSACQTATGDDRSALGIAGVAVRAGVESAIATLWYINDQSTVPLIAEFYRQLRQPNISKAEALRQAQLKMIADENYNHPAVWSPFILIGNWL
ncbi:MAG TPA: hypothetical protein DCE56_01185 [Cyanobacteria bacterium UBA8553]|nr:hypothetical protein [Cyanobacteria bacterium UBA8553]